MTQTHDFTEGVAAFLAKRQAEFTGADLERLHPITVRDVDDRRRWRLTTFLRLVLALPHIYLVEYWGFVALVVGIVNWFIALVRGRTPLAVARVARALRAVLDPRDGVRLPARRSLPEVPRLARDVSRRPARRPARHAVALEDRVSAAARDSGDRLRVRARRRLDRGRDPLVVRRPRGRARALRVPEPRRRTASASRCRLWRTCCCSPTATRRSRAGAASSSKGANRDRDRRHRRPASDRAHRRRRPAPNPADRVLPALARDPAVHLALLLRDRRGVRAPVRVVRRAVHRACAGRRCTTFSRATSA